MDITSSFIIVLSRGSTIPRLLQFVASGVLGQEAFQGGTATAALGLALHFVIAFTLVAVFYLAGRKVPLSAAKPRHSITGDLIQIGIHMFVIGLPTALLLRRFSGGNVPTMVIPSH